MEKWEMSLIGIEFGGDVLLHLLRFYTHGIHKKYLYIFSKN